ncbi:uncharacterized protein avpi1 [Coregonus clupeaformis]|uniref:uncharacterized protein avpi1 n=1 Tax=Coregonus clupeaformis TaxID=59861 RepID=UPI001E1C6246|nr:uncharacterized protein avpi1 [Coregonus clupeaformis]
MEDPEPPYVADGPSLLWQPEKRRSRKSGCSNIFAGVNLRQLRRLFQVAGDRDAEQRARLVWGGGERDGGREGGEEEREEGEMDAGLARALVGFRVRARSRSGIRMEGHREPKFLKAFGHLRIKEGLDHPEEDDEEGDPSDIGELEPLPGGSTGAEGGAPLTDALRPSERPHLGRLGAATRQERTKDPEHYLHRVLH